MSLFTWLFTKTPAADAPAPAMPDILVYAELDARLAQDTDDRFEDDIDIEEIETDLYFTLALAYLDLTTGAVQMVQAGHPHPAVLRPDGAVTWVGEGGMPIGLLEEAQFDSVTFHLEPGDRLMLYSDGITECENRAGEEFGEDGLAALLRRTAEDQGEALLETIVTAVQDFAGRTEFADDVSLVAFDFTGPSAA